MQRLTSQGIVFLLVLCFSASRIDAGFTDYCLRMKLYMMETAGIVSELVMHPTNIPYILTSNQMSSLRAFEAFNPKLRKLAHELNVDRSQILALPRHEQALALSTEIAKKLNSLGRSPLSYALALSRTPAKLSPFVEELKQESSSKGRKIQWNEIQIDRANVSLDSHEINIPPIMIGLLNPSIKIICAIKHELAHDVTPVDVTKRDQSLKEFIEENFDPNLDDEIQTRLIEIQYAERLITSGLGTSEDIGGLNKAIKKIRDDPAIPELEKMKHMRRIVETGAGYSLERYDEVILSTLTNTWLNHNLQFDSAFMRKALLVNADVSIQDSWNDMMLQSKVFRQFSDRPEQLMAYKTLIMKSLNSDERQSESPYRQRLKQLNKYVN